MTKFLIALSLFASACANALPDWASDSVVSETTAHVRVKVEITDRWTAGHNWDTSIHLVDTIDGATVAWLGSDPDCQITVAADSSVVPTRCEFRSWDAPANAGATIIDSGELIENGLLLLGHKEGSAIFRLGAWADEAL